MLIIKQIEIMSYKNLTIDSLAEDCFNRSGYKINKQDLISKITFLVEKEKQFNVDNPLTEDEILEESKYRQLEGAEPFSFAGGARWALRKVIRN